MKAKEHLTSVDPVGQVGATDVAIVGMACRFPGAADYEEYWRNIVSGRNCIREIPSDRWNWRHYSGDPRLEPNKTNIRWGGFIDDIDKFDPLFFGISPSEAAFIDPQHRIFLEAAWHAVEDAGYSVASLSGKAIGIYAGVSKNDYSELMREGRHEIAPYISTGTVHSILVNRVSFLFNLHGKSEAVDTACSSSLVALHNAIRDICSGECEAAIVGGVNALLSPTMFISHSKSGMLSPDGQCRTFSAAANGYVRSEGVGVLFIKPLHQALRDRDHVHAVIKSSSINHGGRSNFLTSPTTEAQAAVVMKAFRAGNIDPRSIAYIEAHGTGTPLGDPIEVNGLKKAFAQLAQEFPNSSGSQEPHCALGSVKTNVGHLESASGMAGIIKVIMAMKYRQIPAIRNFDRLNPYIELENSPFYIAAQTLPWENKGQPKRAGVSSFGMGGVNAHVVLEEAPETQVDPGLEKRDHVIPLSAKKGLLKPYAEALFNYLVWHKNNDNEERLALRDVAYTLQAGRDVFEERVALVASSIDELIGNLNSYVTGELTATQNIFVGDSRSNGDASPELSSAKSSMKVTDLAARWVRGTKVDWGCSTECPPRRVPLPTYPFARKRCWFTDIPPKISNLPNPNSITSQTEINDSVRILRPTDFFIRDHIVQGKQMLPGVAHLELARAAVTAQPGNLQQVRMLKDVYWMTPVVVETKDVQVEIRLTPQNDQVNFEIVQNHTVHSKGSLTNSSHDTRDGRKLELTAVHSRCSLEKTKTELYALFKDHGLAYGSSFQVIESCVYNENEILVDLKLPQEMHESLGDFALHPSIMDGVFQAVTALSLLGPHHLGKQFIPFYLEAAEIVNPMGDHCFVYATVNSTGAQEEKFLSFHASLLDSEGNVLVNIKNLQKRPIVERQKKEVVRVMPRDIYYGPVWRRRQLKNQAGFTTKTLVLFAHDKGTVQSFRRYCGQSGTVVLIQAGAAYRQMEANVYQVNPCELASYERVLQELKANGLPLTQVAYLWGLDVQNDSDLRSGLDNTIYGVLNFTQAAFNTKFRENVDLVYVHALEQGFPRSIHSMVAGFARTLKYENPRFDYLTLGIDEPTIENIARAVHTELGSASNENTLREIIYRGGQRYERQIVRETIPNHWEAGDLARITKPGGVYVISGGAGGLGSIFSHYLAEKYRATILWLGRSAMTPTIAHKIREIEKAGGKCEYFSVDITDREALSQVFSQIKTVHREINGVIHAAGLIEDAFILRKQKDSFARVVEPKVLGAINLDAMTQYEKLDFFVVFSSIAALMPNQGQCDYAAANSFLDSFVEVRNRQNADHQRSGISLALNWPLWAHGGMRVTPEEERHLLRVFGMKPLATADGLAIFETSLALAKSKFPDVHQIIAIDGDKEKIERRLGLEVSASEEDMDEASKAQLESEIKSIFAARLGLTPTTIDGKRTIGELGVDSSTLIGVIQDINQRFDAGLNPTLLFDINTINKLAAYLVEIGKSEVAVPVHNEASRWNCSLIDVEQSDPVRRVFSKTFKTSEFYLRDHVVDGQYNMPGACYVEMARQAGDLLLGNESIKKLVNNYWASPLSSPEEDFTAQVHITPKQDHLAYEIVSFTTEGEKRLHAMGQIAQDETSTQAEIKIDIAEVTSRCDEIQYPGEIYKQILSEGLIVGSTFQPMKQIFLNGAEALAMLELPEEIKPSAGDYILNPALLTGAFQAALISNKRNIGGTRRYIPIGMDELDLIAPIPAECYVYCRPRPANARNEEMRKFDLEICRPDGVVVVRLKGFSIRALKEVATSAQSGITAMEESDSVEQIDEARDYLRSLIAGPIGLSADEIDFYTGFDRYGVNSVMVVELNEIFENIFGRLSKTLFFEYRNIDELGRYFLENHRDKILSALPQRQDSNRRPGSDKRHPAEKEDRLSNGKLKTDLESHIVDATVHERQDIAIVSAAARVPGARNLKEFWDLLKEGRDCITEIPPDRFNYRKHFDADPEHNRIYSKWGGFIDEFDRFDPTFFNISPREAELIDPQERLLLEVIWEMLEHAGYTRQRLWNLSNRRVGVFVGALWQPYESAGIEATSSGNVIGPSSLLYSIANRISYFFDLSGPSMAIDTACSSSLTALHLACQSIRNGESQFAIAAGVNLSLTVSKYLFLSQNRFLSTDGRCRSYGAGGDGYVPGEGVCALLLKPLPNAIADADSILAVIKGSAINHGGHTNGYTVPNPKAQGSVIAQALQDARIDPHAITYIEGHGTGTSLGDPIEIDGLEKALGLTRDGNHSCAIGSVKSNIGHLEAAAGIASAIKVILQMQNGQLAPSLHAGQLNSNIDFDKSLFRVQRELAPWARPEFMKDGTRVTARRCAGVSSFGAGGSNAHLILEEYDGPLAPDLRSNYCTDPALCVFSARTEDRLFELAVRFKDYLREAAPDSLHDIAHTLQLGREAMRERLAVVAGSVDELSAALADFVEHKQQQNNWCRGSAAIGRRGHTDGIHKIGLETLEAWWKGKNLFQIAEAWVQGLEVDWALFYGGRNYGFLPLPTYPFANERYWIETRANGHAAAQPIATAALHPLLHRNTSDLSEQRYSSTFTGEEFFFRDHLVRADGRTLQKVLPGVACLEMVRVAIEQAWATRPESAILELHNTVWAHPIVASDKKQVSIALWANDNDQIDYEIYSQDSEQEVVHCQGRAIWSRQAAPARLNLEHIKEQMGQSLEPSSVYAAWSRMGLVHGPAFQGISVLHRGSGQLLAHLRLPQAVEDTSKDYVVHPSLMDSALQGFISLIDGWSESNQLRLPFALESLRIVSPCDRDMVAWVRYTPGSRVADKTIKLDVDLCDALGNVCAEIRGFSPRVLSKEITTAAAQDEAKGSLSATPVWQASRLAAPSEPQATPVAVVAEIESESLADKTQEYLRKQFSGLFKLPFQKIDAQVALEEYGLDSILAMKLTNQLEKTFGSLSKTLFFEYQTIRGLTEYFIQSHSARLATLFAKTNNGSGQTTVDARLETPPSVDAKVISRRRFSRSRSAPGPYLNADAIAIIGLSGCYPAAVNLEAFWHNLCEGKDCITEVPKNRWNWREYFSEDRTKGGHHYSKWGGFIAGVDEFDPLFFNISPLEAELMDPQERLFLQHSWKAIEDAGYTRASLQLPSEDLAGQVGVYAGVWYSEYHLFGAEAGVRGKRLPISGSVANIANRVSYALNLHGPSMTLDTMCSASLTAIHIACQDLKLGRTSLAIAGGVNVSIHPNKYLMLSAAQALSGTGHCHSFGEDGDGYVPADGVGVVVLKRLSEAKRDGDHIYGIIRGSALTHGGKTNGYTVPNPHAQSSAISRALAEAKVDARHISYIETHGTGTKLGDPIEIAALSKAFQHYTCDIGFCQIGSVKSNIGHCESAAGIAGLTKILLQMQHEQLVPSLHSEQLNPHIDFGASPFVVNQELRGWERPEVEGWKMPRIAGISSFGAGGSNAHLIVEEYEPPVQPALAPTNVIILLSARTFEQLQQKARELFDFVRAQPSTIDLVAMAYTLQVGREAMEERLGFVVNSVEQMAEKLQAYVNGGQDIEDAYQGQVKDNKEMLSLFSSDADLQQAIDKWIANRKFSRLLDLWVKGLEVDWSKLYGEVKPQRISLPTYPFAKERYWIDARASRQVAVNGATTAVLHPMLHSNTSDLSVQRYCSTFTGEEFFLTDHQVKARGGVSQKVLPGVAYLEMARAAIKQAVPLQQQSTVLELHNTVWTQPIIVSERKQVSIALLAKDQDEIDYEIYSQDGDQEIVHCQGRALWSREPAAARLDVEQIKREMGQGQLERDNVYAACAHMGLIYGPGFQGITVIHRGSNQGLAQLRLPRAVEDTSGDYVLHPSLMDAALQAAAGLIEGWFEGSQEPRLPFALESVRIVSPCTREMFAWVRYSPGSQAGDKVVKLDLDLCDEQGNVCVQMRRLSSRVLRQEINTPVVQSPGIGHLLAIPVWQASKVEVSSEGGKRVYAEHYVMVCEQAQVNAEDLGRLLGATQCVSLQAEEGKTIAQRYSEYAEACFEKLQAILRGKPQGRVLVQIVVGGKEEQGVLVGLTGLLKTAGLENPQLVGQLIVVGGEMKSEDLAERLQAEKEAAEDRVIRYTGGEREVLRWQEVEEEGEDGAKWGQGFQEGGVYLITGGLGRLGIVFAKEILRQTEKGKVILTGRTMLDGEKQRQLEGLEMGAAGRVSYRRIDLGKLGEVKQLIGEIEEEYGELNGIVHSAGMIADNFLVKKGREEFRAVLEPKVTGTYNLDEASAEAELDFFVLFSSVAGASGNVGQADYAAANGFMDGFTRYRNQRVGVGERRGRTRAINWGLWQAGGMGIDAGIQELLYQTTGLQPMQTATGLDAFHRSLVLPYDQVLAAEGDRTRILTALLDGSWVSPKPQAKHDSVNKKGSATELHAANTSRPLKNRPVELQARKVAQSDEVQIAKAGQKACVISDQMIERHVRYMIRECIAQALKIEESRIQDDRSFSDYGVDSIIAVNLVNRISQQCGITLPTTTVFDYNNIELLTKFMLREHRTAVLATLQAEAGSSADEQERVEQIPAEVNPRPNRFSKGRNRGELVAPAGVEKGVGPVTTTGEGVYRRVVLESPGSIKDVKWIESEAVPLGEHEVRIAVTAFSLNFGDLLCVKGLYPNMPAFPFTPGFEVSGTVVSVGEGVTQVEVGSDVIALTGEDMGGHATLVTCPERLVFRKPRALSFEEACSLPSVGVTMIDAFRKARLQPGEKILIQTAAGGTGLIAVQLAQHAGAEIYATAGAPHKLDYLKKLGVRHLIHYREMDFEQEIGRMTGGGGVDVVINTLPGDAIQKGLNCLSPGGRYIEIAMTALKSAKTIDLSVLSNNQTFYSVDLMRLKRKNPALVMEYCNELMNLVEQGVVRPTISKVVEFPNVQEAFRQLEDRDNIGKVIVTIPEAYRYRESGVKATRAQVTTVNSAAVIQKEPIAIIGMSGKFGRTNTVDELWESLARGEELTEAISRWPLSQEDAKFCPRGSFLQGIDCFDPLFFKIPGVEATYMDPQQRLFLEEAWKALEDAGYAGAALQGRQCGVYVGCVDEDYAKLLHGKVPPQAFWGNARSLIPARIAYYLDLQGPAVAVDTACSSSLVATHMACQALWAGEVEIAIAGGVFLQCTPGFYLDAGGAGMLSASGHCYTFDERAEGFVPGEGVGVIVLKRLREAIAHGDHIYGVVRGSGINQDGTTNGITAPSASSQERLERHVYESFGIHPEEIQMVEAHGTGTKLGDPVEYHALTRSFRKDTDKKNYCAIGSIKTNLGHTTAAAGVAGVIKVLLSLQHKQIPPSLNYEKGNPHIDFAGSPFYVNTSLREWTVEGESRRCAAVSSFGFSGTNAHIVIEEAPDTERRRPECPGHLIALSGRTAEQLRQQVEQLVQHVEQNQAEDCGDISYTLLLGRKHWNHRLTCIVRSSAELLSTLKKWLDKGNASQVSVFQIQENDSHEKESLKHYGSQCIEECRKGVDPVTYLERLAAIAELFGQGYSLPLERLFTGDRYRRISLPTYPFARERYWVPMKEEFAGRANGGATGKVGQLHPLLHENTSDLSEQSYRADFSGEEFFLKDHVVQGQKVLPGVAYLEMVRAAIEQALPVQPESSILELQNTAWLTPIFVTENKQVSVAVLADDDDQIDYEVYSLEAEKKTIHCQGQAVFNRQAAPARLDLEQLKGQMKCGTLEASKAYAMFARMCLNYGPAHQGITAIYMGEKQLLSELHLPAVVEASQQEYVLHPSLMDSALQASIALIVDLNHVPHKPPIPFVLESLRILSACTEQMTAWVRYSDRGSPEDKTVQLNIDLCDQQGNVCVQMHGFGSRTLEGEIKSHQGNLSCGKSDVIEDDSSFDNDFYQQLIADVVKREVSVDEAMRLG